MIKAIFFDFDGVLTTHKNGWYSTCLNLSKETGFDLDRLIRGYRLHSKKLNLNKTTHTRMWVDFCKCVGKNIGRDLLEKAFLSTPLNKKMLVLAGKLKNRYKLGIITDNNKERFDLLTEKFKLNDLFDSITLSAKVNATKNGKIIFQDALKSLNAKAKESIFIDNAKQNLKVPKKMGFKTVYYDHERNDMALLLTKLERYGVKA
ncbi:MAG: HAD hydrolase-like protein [Candidatus Diapherotrites archaeon]